MSVPVLQCTLGLLCRESVSSMKLLSARQFAAVCSVSSNQATSSLSPSPQSSFSIDSLGCYGLQRQQIRGFSITSSSLAHGGGHKGRSTMAMQNKQSADQFVRWLDPKERDNLKNALSDVEEEIRLEDTTPVVTVPPNRTQLNTMFIANAIPFIGFGFVDNCIMCICGDFIDGHLGLAFGFSTLAAAGFGNLISDMAGIGLASYIEIFAAKLGFAEPPLNRKQRALSITKNVGYLGRCIGVGFGCLLGMTPLLLK